jgi:O-antigen ligase
MIPAGRDDQRQAYLAILAVMALGFARVTVIGELYVCELVLAAIVIVHVLRGRSLQLDRPVVIVIGLLALWLCGLVAADLYRAVAFADFARGWARIVFTALNLLGLYLLTKGIDGRVRVAFLGLAAGQALGCLVMPTVYAQSDLWKFGLASPVTILAVVLASSQPIWRRRFGPFVVLVVMAGVNVWLGARSVAGMCFLASIYTVVAAREEHPEASAQRRRSLSLALVVPVLGVVAVLVSSYVYGSMAKSGVLGMAAQVKYEFQSAGRYSFLLGGRNEIVFSSLAIRESPILGHGSFASFPVLLQAEGAAQLVDWGYEYLLPGEDQPDLLPTHSGLFGAWVEAGILAVPFWLFLLVLLWRGCIRTMQRGDDLTPLRVFITIAVSWDVLFSPFAADRRITVPLAILLLIGGEHGDRGTDDAQVQHHHTLL